MYTLKSQNVLRWNLPGSKSHLHTLINTRSRATQPPSLASFMLLKDKTKFTNCIGCFLSHFYMIYIRVIFKMRTGGRDYCFKLLLICLKPNSANSYSDEDQVY